MAKSHTPTAKIEMKPTVCGGSIGNGALSDCAWACQLGAWPALALSEPTWVGTAARRHREQAGQCSVLFPAGDVFALEPAAQSDPLGRQPLRHVKGSAGHRLDHQKLNMRLASASACAQPAWSPCASR